MQNRYVIKKDYLNSIYRVKANLKTRENYLRLDKNEKTTNFHRNIIKFLKKKISSFFITSYPDLGLVYKKLANYLKVREQEIVITSGADLAIKNCFELFLKPKDIIISTHPTFAMVDIYSKLFQIKQEKIFYEKNLNLNLVKFKKKITPKVKMIIISNPNNPTGTIIKKKDLIDLVKKADKLNIPFVIDEVYYGFTDNTLINLINKYKNLVIIRTFSKSFGIAGLRAGYIVSNSKIAQLLFKFKPMYEINSIAALIINYFLDNKKYIKKNLNEINLGKRYLVNKFKINKLIFIDTHTNFIHIKAKNKKSSQTIFDHLFKNKILVRKGGPGIKGYEDYLRITLGDKEQMKKLFKFLIRKRSLLQ